MGQAAGVKKRKGRTGNFDLHNRRRKSLIKDRQKLRAPLTGFGIPAGDDRHCAMTRIQHAGMVSSLNKYDKPSTKRSMEIAMGCADQKKKVVVSEVISELEERRRERKAAVQKKKGVVLPPMEAKVLSGFLDRYGEDYKAMEFDPMNYDQLTAKQLRKKVERFKSAGPQFAAFLRDRGLLHDEEENTEAAEEQQLIAEKKRKKFQQEFAVKKAKMMQTYKSPTTELEDEGSDEHEDDEDEDEEENEESKTDNLEPRKAEGKTKHRSRRARARKAKMARARSIKKAENAMAKT